MRDKYLNGKRIIKKKLIYHIASNYSYFVHSLKGQSVKTKQQLRPTAEDSIAIVQIQTITAITRNKEPVLKGGTVLQVTQVTHQDITQR